MVHWNAAKHVVKYLIATRDIVILFTATMREDLVASSDADFAADVDSRKSTSSILLKLSGAPVRWKSSKQRTVATSTVNSQFIAACANTREVIWTRQLLCEIGFQITDPTVVYMIRAL